MKWTSQRVKKSIVAVVFGGLLGTSLLGSFASEKVPAAAPPAPFAVYPSAITLDTLRDRQSIVAQATEPSGVTRDLTGEIQISVADPNLARMENGALVPAGDGETTVQVKHGEQVVTLPLTVRNAAAERPISFRLDVMPVFMYEGCNSGSCHGSARGQDGFGLSLFGYDPEGDYHRLTREIPNRRINLAQPDKSLILTKSTGQAPHTGGTLFSTDSPSYQTLLRWVQAGAPMDSADVATPTSLELLPEQIVLEGEGATQKLVARAHYSDGTDRDVTGLVVFMTSNDNSATIDDNGVVTARNRGEAFVMARFATFTVGTQVIVVPKDQPFTWPAPPENNYIDGLVNEKLRKLRIAPSELADDATFMRRVYLDVIGLLPTRAEYDAFIADTDPQKREKLVDALLARPEFADVWTMKWAELLKIRSSDDLGMSYKTTLLYHDWLREKIAANTPVNTMVRELLTASGGTFDTPATTYYMAERDTLKLMENTAQVFAGMRLQCAQCHNHPFDRWTMNDYYGFASFFSQVGRKESDDKRQWIVFPGGGEVKNPVTDKPVLPTFLGGATPEIQNQDRRVVLADWLTAPENPYFARNLANIAWAHFFGRGIVEPVDDVRISNPPVNPALLDALTERLVAYNFDMKQLVRDICTSRTYQLSSRANDTNGFDDRNFARAPIRRIRAEVLLDVISQVTDTRDKFRGLPDGARAVEIADGGTNNYFLTTFGRATRETVCTCEVKMEPNLSQALHLLNGDTVNRKVQQGGIIKHLLNDEKLAPEQIIEHLYLRCLLRKPTEQELERLRPMLAEEGADPQQVLTDIFWALLNSKEFIFNH